jgi:acyl-CoA thioester hydrolase
VLLPAPDAAIASPLLRVHRTATDAEMDELGHISNIAYVRWVQDAAGTASAAAGWTLPRYQQEGAAFVVRTHTLTYYAPAMAGDAIVCTTWIDSWKGASSPRHTRITRATDGVLLCGCITLWAFMDLQTGRPRRIPAAMLADFARVPDAGLDLPFIPGADGAPARAE